MWLLPCFHWPRPLVDHHCLVARTVKGMADQCTGDAAADYGDVAFNVFLQGGVAIGNSVFRSQNDSGERSSMGVNFKWLISQL